jgi:DNA-3-methyladenine glycosylase
VKKATSRRSRSSVNKLGRSFFARPAAELARELIGKALVRRLHGREFRARVVETEAYLGSHDLASRASKGRTRRTEVLFGPAGRAYVHLIYSMYEMLNIAAGAAGRPRRC